ncbi:MAG: LPS export ABC transporter ATP-binding protein [Planctomycetes bacterium]|nr:LPS export ABC transporter ATP-binding protein [Planctomycetota bacterium]
MPDASPVLLGKNLSKRYAGRSVVKGIDILVHAGEIVGLLGRNGAGKSTTFKMLMGIVKPDGGEVSVAGAAATGLPMHKRVRLGLGYLAQEPTIFARLTVEDNLQIALEAAGVPAGKRTEKLEALLKEFGLGRVRANAAGRCSGGERRRLEIARTLITEPKVILLDEPFAGVDPIAVEDLRKLVASLADRGLGVLLTDHAVHEVLPMTDRSYIVVDGVVIKEGPPREIAADETVRREYLGERFKLDEDVLAERRREARQD